MAIVLSEEDEHRFVEVVNVAIAVLLGAFSLVMENRRGDIAVLLSCLEQAIGKVDVLAIHEKVLVEQSALLEGGTAKEHECTADDFDRVLLFLVKILHIVSSEDTTSREKSAKSRHLAKSHKRGWDASS